MELIIWILLAAACYYVAKDKNRNAVVWGILGLLFGIFALVIVALLPKLPRRY